MMKLWKVTQRFDRIGEFGDPQERSNSWLISVIISAGQKKRIILNKDGQEILILSPL